MLIMILTREVQAVKESLGKVCTVHSTEWAIQSLHLKNGLDRYLYLSSIKKLSMQSELHIPIFNFPSPVWKINETFLAHGQLSARHLQGKTPFLVLFEPKSAITDS